MIIGAVNNRRVRILNLRQWILCVVLLILGLATLLKSSGRCSKSQPTVNLVLALTKSKDYSWTSNLTIPKLKVIPFIADDQRAQFHPPANKGREALTYLTYLHQFYDSLPGISIFTHGDDVTWHIDPIFGKSTAHALNLLNLDEVLNRGYLNLRTSWKGGCPAWINTTSSFEGSTGKIFFSKALRGNETMREKSEEPYMKAAFEENFLGTKAPEVLAQPCCSQFAVSKDTIRSVPRQRYQEKIDWLLKTPLSDQLTGRIWEHMWQFLFLGEAQDCPRESEALCRGWRICFETQVKFDDWNRLADKVQKLKREATPEEVNSEEIRRLEVNLNTLRTEAIQRGKARAQEKVKITVDLI